MDGHVARTAKFARNRRDVKRVCGLVLKFDVFDFGVVARENFRHGIREIRGVAGADVAFHDRQLAVRLGDDEVARQNRFAALLRRRNVNELHQFSHFDAGRDKNKRAVGKERLVQRGERVVRRVRVFAEMFFDEPGILRQRGGQVFNFHAAGHRLDAGKFRREKPVHEHHAMPGQPGENGFLESRAFSAISRDFAREVKRQFRNRRDIREAPVLVVQRRETLFGKAGDARLAQRREPIRLRCGLRAVELFHYRVHRVVWIVFGHGQNQLPLERTVFHAIEPCASLEVWSAWTRPRFATARHVAPSNAVSCRRTPNPPRLFSWVKLAFCPAC